MVSVEFEATFQRRPADVVEWGGEFSPTFCEIELISNTAGDCHFNRAVFSLPRMVK